MMTVILFVLSGEIFSLGFWFVFVISGISFYWGLLYWVRLNYLNKNIISYIFLFLESWKTYLDKIKKATANYEDCSNKKCACYSDVIGDDLRVWKDRGGITKNEFDDTARRGVHYQIINHKLYREEDCMFPFRFNIFLCLVEQWGQLPVGGNSHSKVIGVLVLPFRD